VAKKRANGEGTIYKSGKRWRAQISINGKRIGNSFNSKSEALKWRDSMRNKVNKGLTYEATKITVYQYLTDWLPKHALTVKPRTIENYTQISRDYIIPYIGDEKLHDLRTRDIENLYVDLHKKGVSARNIRVTHSVFHRSLEDAVRDDIVGFNAAHGARKPRAPHKEMQYWDDNTVMQFLMYVIDDRNETLYHIAIKYGLRQGEILGLMWSDLNWMKGTLQIKRQVQRVPGKGRDFSPPKTRSGRRTISLGRETLQLLRKHKDRQQLEIALAGPKWEDYNLIFPSRLGTPHSGSNLLKEFKRTTKAAGLPQIRFHDLRHTNASIMLNEQISIVAVSRILGHTKPSTTMDYYGHLIPATYEAIGDRMDELLTPVPVDVGDKSEVLGQNLSDST